MGARGMGGGAKSEAARAARGGGGGGGLLRKSIFVGHLPMPCSLKELAALAAPFGPLESVRAAAGGQHYGFLNFAREGDAAACHEAAQRAPFTLRGARLQVHFLDTP